MSGDAYHITTPNDDGDGGYRAMESAMSMANISPDKIDYINAHGTSTQIGDDIELKAIMRLTNENKKIKISSTKSSIGHLLGAAGSVEAIFSILSIKDNIVPATLNLENQSHNNSKSFRSYIGRLRRLGINSLMKIKSHYFNVTSIVNNYVTICFKHSHCCNVLYTFSVECFNYFGRNNILA